MGVQNSSQKRANAQSEAHRHIRMEKRKKEEFYEKSLVA